MKIYRGFPQRLHHTVPHWVEPGALFHIRIALDRQKEQKALTDPALAQVRHGESVPWRTICDSAKFYEIRKRWHITLFLLMPDHLHALLSFTRDESMSEVIRDWKRFHARMNHIIWRRDISIIVCDLMNAARSSQPRWITSGRIQWLPVCARNRKTGRGLSIHSHASIEVDRLLLKTMLKSIAEGARFPLPKSRAHQNLGGKAALVLATRSTRQRWIGFS